jgi:hypothetical protein
MQQPAKQEIQEGCNERQRCDERVRHRQMGSGGVMRGDTANSQGGREASTTEKKRGTTRYRGTMRGGQMEATSDGRRQRTRGNMTTSWGRQEA